MQGRKREGRTRKQKTNRGGKKDNSRIIAVHHQREGSNIAGRTAPATTVAPRPRRTAGRTKSEMSKELKRQQTQALDYLNLEIKM